MIALSTGCTDRARETSVDAGADASSSAPTMPSPSASTAQGLASSAAPPVPPPLRCPRGMMRVAGAFCVDRWEATLVDRVTGMPLSPYYPPDRRLALQIAATWEHDHLEIGSEEARRMPVPELPAWQRDHDADPLALSRPGVKPNGYVSGAMAARACENAQKRLCRRDEWVKACEGEAARQFPYGESYSQGACNVFRATHPGIVLHDNPSIGHFDPRMNLVAEKDGSPLLRVTGATPRCKSEWEGDAAWDMNGNLDEWVMPDEDAGDAGSPAGDGGPDAGKSSSNKGLFLGGFYARSKRDGCLSSVSRHQVTYLDYSTGVRCCWSP
jgi:sulfatase modifying factor 1